MERIRDAIVRAAAAMAAVDGLESLSIGGVAAAVGLSKSGVGASAGLALGTRPGPVNELLSRYQSEFGELLRGFAATALAQGELGRGEDPGRLAFELNGIILAADTNFVSHDDPAVLTLAWQIVRQRLRPAEDLVEAPEGPDLPVT